MKRFIFLLFFTILLFANCGTFNILKTKVNTQGVPIIKGETESAAYISVVGKGVAPEGEENSARGELLAERAAIIDGYRLLSEKLAGILINSSSSDENFTVSKDKIISQTQTYVRGAQIVDIKHNEKGFVEVVMRLKLNENLLREIARN
jgi:hypothetical protein